MTDDESNSHLMLGLLMLGTAFIAGVILGLLL
jgi:hypothetical protein